MNHKSLQILLKLALQQKEKIPIEYHIPFSNTGMRQQVSTSNYQEGYNPARGLLIISFAWPSPTLHKSQMNHPPLLSYTI